jgi:dimethylargininase
LEARRISILALTHLPSPSLEHGLRTHVARSLIDFDLALKQHQNYCRLLRACGAEVRILDVNRDLPDATFIEDTAVVLDEVAVVASMGTPARRAELAGIERELWNYRKVHRIEAPATIEGGDVLRIGRTLLVGISSRTNHAGLRALEDVVRPFHYEVFPVPVTGCLHLKTACTALPDGSLLVNPDWLECDGLSGFDLVFIPPEEPWAANTLPIGSKIVMPADQERTVERLRRLGFDVCGVLLSEFAKAEGGVTCLSLVFDEVIGDR